MPLPSIFKQVMEEHQQRLERIAERRGVQRLQRVWEDSQAEVQRKLSRLVRSGKGSTFSAHEHRIVLAQLRNGQAYVAGKMVGELGDASKDAQRDTLHALTRDIGKLERKYTGSSPVLPVEDAARFAGVMDKRSTSLLKRHRDSMSEYGARTVGKMEESLAKGLLQNEAPHQMIDRIVKVADVEWWQGERIVRTELSWASNATQVDGIVAAAEAVPELMMQWREHVADDGEPLDDRVAWDSIMLHGQVVKPGAVFKMPPYKAVTDTQKSLAGGEWTHPPNRPNDRAVVAPWRATWGVPGWRLVGGRKVQVR